MKNGVFMSHHDGFNFIAQQNFTHLHDINIRFVNAVYNLPLGIEFCDTVAKKFHAKACAFAGPITSESSYEELRNVMRDDWNRMFRHYRPLYDSMYKWANADFIIVGLQALNIPILRSICPNTPIIYYPRMFTMEWENSFLDPNDEKLFYVMHDEEMMKYDFPCKNKKFIMSSLNPACYGPYTGEINKVLTVFHNLDITLTDEWEPDFNKTPKTPENSYPKIVDGMPFQLYGATRVPGWMGASWINCHDVVQEMRKHRCGLIYSRIFSAIATAQMLASGVPSVGFVAQDNEMHRIIKHGESGFISRNIEETRNILQHLLNDYEYAKRIGESGREAYYARHNWEDWKKNWSDLIHSL